METELEARIKQRESRVAVEGPIRVLPTPAPAKRGWRAFVGVDANNPDFADAERFGREWWFANSPTP